MDWSTPRLRHLQPVLIALLLSAFSALALAQGGDDWVLVQRFEEQQKKASAGDAQAMYEVGRMYERGRGTPADINKAVRWFENAAKKGQHNALARLGIMYLEGQGVPQDYSKAYKNLSEAAIAGVPAAQYFLALMYEEGHGVRTNTVTAMKWYKKAATGGYYQAQKAIARLGAKRPTLEQPPETARAKAKSAPVKKRPNLSEGLMQTVLKGNWQRNGKGAGFLPSSATTCSEEANSVITCQSDEQTRDTGFSVITFVTVASLSEFSANDEFSVTYYNNVIRAASENDAATAKADDEEEFSAAPISNAVSRVQLGRQKTQHKLECTLESGSKLVCVKNLISTLSFENKN